MRPLAAAVLVAALPWVQSVPRQANDDATACVAVGAASLWGGTGWNHLVYLSDRCGYAVACLVSSNLEPEEHHANVDDNETVVVVTAMGSPDRVFTPVVSCERAAAP